MNKANNKTQKKNGPVKRKPKKKSTDSRFILVGAVLLTVAVIILAGIVFSSDKVNKWFLFPSNLLRRRANEKNKR